MPLVINEMILVAQWEGSHGRKTHDGNSITDGMTDAMNGLIGATENAWAEFRRVEYSCGKMCKEMATEVVNTVVEQVMAKLNVDLVDTDARLLRGHRKSSKTTTTRKTRPASKDQPTKGIHE